MTNASFFCMNMCDAWDLVYSLLELLTLRHLKVFGTSQTKSFYHQTSGSNKATIKHS